MSNKAVLAKLLHKSDPAIPKLLLVTDSAEICGRGVICTLVKSHLQSESDVRYLTTTLSTNKLKTILSDADLAKRVTYYDGCSDPAGWENKESSVRLNLPLDQIINTSSLGSSDKCCVVIDKFDDILNHQDSLELIRSVHSISKVEQVEQLIVYCSRDCVPESVLSSLCHIASATLHLQAAAPLCRCKIMIKRLSGKVVQSYEEFSLNPDFTVKENKVVEKLKNQDEEKSDTDAVLAAQTTFNLSLTEDQRMSKNRLLLPHTRVQSTGGQIHYTPDDVDDWDEEDPDDDLDI